MVYGLTDTITTTNAGFEVLVAATIKNVVFWGVIPCISERIRRFGKLNIYFYILDQILNI
jgi:hypothetical protein